MFNRTDWSPLTRHTVWALMIGGFIHWLQISAINQNMIQRYLSLPNLQSARRYPIFVIRDFFLTETTMLIFNNDYELTRGSNNRLCSIMLLF